MNNHIILIVFTVITKKGVLFILEKIKFVNDSNIYDGFVSFMGQNIVSISFLDILPSADIITSGFELLNEHNMLVQGQFLEYTTIYRIYEDEPTKFELSNDESVYVPPVEEIPEDPEPYIPTPEEIQAMLYQNKNYKIELSKTMLAEYLKNNPLHSTAHNGIDGVYSVTSEKQTLMMSQYMTYQIEKSVNPDTAKLTWNETGKACEDWTENEFLQLILEIKTYVYPLVSYQQHLEEKIGDCSTQEELDAIVIDYIQMPL